MSNPSSPDTPVGMAAFILYRSLIAKKMRTHDELTDKLALHGCALQSRKAAL